jgi:hypothetical protein
LRLKVTLSVMRMFAIYLLTKMLYLQTSFLGEYRLRQAIVHKWAIMKNK